MISDILELEDGKQLHADVIVIGSGPAGAEAARQLAASGASVLVLESGRRNFNPDIQQFSNLEFAGKPHRAYDDDANFHSYLPPEYRGLNNIRQFGGTSNSWTGKWRVYTESDFRDRPWVAHSRWPLGANDLREAYLAVAAEYGLGDVLNELDDPRFEQPRRDLARAGLCLGIHYWEQSKLRVKERYGAAWEQSDKIRLVLGATATQLVLDASHRRVIGVECRCLEGRRISAQGDAVIVATGGIEAPRLLLASNQQVPAGIGNEQDLVGRFYMDHLKNQSITLRPGPGLAALAADTQKNPRPRFGIGFGLKDALLDERKLLQHALYLSPRYERLGAKARRLLSGRRPIVRDEIGPVDHYHCKLAAEQAPNRDSRLYLSNQCDALGVPTLVADWRFTELDHRSLAETSTALTEAFAEARLGDLVFPSSPMTVDDMTDAAHPIGATRMADSPAEGVVDRDCRVFGIENLYVASSSVFPTGSVYSPTYTIMALALRIAWRLTGHVSRDVAASV